MSRSLRHLDQPPIAAAMARTRADCLRQLVSLASGACVSIIIGASLIAFWLRDHAPADLLGVWLFAIISLGASRLVFAAVFRRKFDGSDVDRWERYFIGIIGAGGFVWGMLAWMPMNDPDHHQLFLIIVILFCVLLVGNSTLIASGKALAVFALSLAAPLIVRTLTLEPRLAVMAAGGLAVMSALMLSAFRTNRQTMMSALVSQHEMGELLQQQQVIYETAGEGIVFLKPGPDYVISCNRRFAELFGYPHESMIGMPPWRWHPNREQWKALVTNSLPAIVAGHSYHQILRLQRSDGSQFWGDITGKAVAASDLSAGTVWIVSDITDQRAAEAALRNSEARFRDLVKLSSDLYWEQDENFRFTYFDGAESLRARLPLDRILGQTRWETRDIKGIQGAKWLEHIAALARHEAFRDFTYQIDGTDGEKYWMSVSGNPLFDDSGAFLGYHGTASDITLRVEAEERYRHLAYHDTLTQLPNRRLLVDRLEQAIRSASRSGSRVALLLLDLDGFKQVNDRHGHAAGDRVLEAVAARLREAVRDADTVARMGGDEFVVLLPDLINPDNAVKVADKIHDSICEPIADGHYEYRIGVSIGISVYPDHGDTADALLHRADHAMYHGKSDGGRTTRLFDLATLN